MDETFKAKWVIPLSVKIEGDPNDKDREALEKIITAYNSMRGFPGMSIVLSDENVRIVFSGKDNFQTLKAESAGDSKDKSYCLWKGESDGTIETAYILIEPGGTQGHRNFVILHETFHLIGFAGHTDNIKSIINAYSLVWKGLCKEDILSMRMIYNPDIKPGENINGIRDYYSALTVTEFLAR